MRKPLLLAEIVGGLGLLGVLIAVVIHSAQLSDAAAAGLIRHYAAPTPGEIDVALHSTGITPETLAASGATTIQTTSIVNEASAILNADPGLIKSKNDALYLAKRLHDRLVRLVRSGRASQQEIADCQQAKVDLATARSNLEGVLDGFFGDLTDQLSAQSRVAVSAMRTNDRWDMPIEFKVISRDESRWLRLRGALANERITARDEDEDQDSNDRVFLAQERGNTQISLARVNLDTNYAAIKAAWDEALQE